VGQAVIVSSYDAFIQKDSMQIDPAGGLGK